MSIEVVLSKAPAETKAANGNGLQSGNLCVRRHRNPADRYLPCLRCPRSRGLRAPARPSLDHHRFWRFFPVGQLIVGPLLDRLGGRSPILIGLCIFMLGTIGVYLPTISSACWSAGRYKLPAHVQVRLARAIARDLFDGQALAKMMASITIATAAAPGFSPLVGSALDHLLRLALGICVCRSFRNLRRGGVCGISSAKPRQRPTVPCIR